MEWKVVKLSTNADAAFRYRVRKCGEEEEKLSADLFKLICAQSTGQKTNSRNRLQRSDRLNIDFLL
jgi:hypothetical protein